MSTNNNRHLVAVIKKPADRQELFAALDYFSIAKVTILVVISGRLNETTVHEWFMDSKLDYSINIIDHSKLTKKYFFNELSKYEKFQYIAIPVNYHRVYYKNVSTLRKVGKTVIHISEGCPESFGLLGYCLTTRSTNWLDFIKTCYIFFELLFCKADYCFYQLYPFKSCFAKKVLPSDTGITKIPYDILSHLKSQRIETLLLPGWGETIESLLNSFPDVTNYCATKKTLFFHINGKDIPIQKFISAEDILNANFIKRVIGAGTTGILYAKLKNKDIDCTVVLNGWLNKKLGPLYEHCYKKKGKSIGIKFIYKKTYATDTGII